MGKLNFDSLYSKLVSGEITCEEASKFMKEPDARTTINSYINKGSINSLVPYMESELQTIMQIINIAQFIFNNSGCDTGLSDSEYDALYAIMLSNGGADIISAPIIPNHVKKVCHHTYPSLRGTLTKIFYLTNDEERKNPSRRYLDEWKSSMESKIFTNSGRHVDMDKLDIYVFPKFDGVSGIFELNSNNTLDKVLTRGFTEMNTAEDISHVFKPFFCRKYQERKKTAYGLKTEVMMMEDDLKYYNEKYKTDYKNTRSIVSAILNSDEYDEEKASLLHIVPLRIGYADGSQELATEVFKDYPYIRCQLKDRDKIREFAYNHRYVNGGLRCDGAVIYIIDEEIQKILGRENEKNQFEVAYKFTEESEMSKLVDVNFQMGVFGRITPVATVKPVKLKGNTITNISLGSIGRFKSLNLRKGDKVKVLYDIIPYMVFDEDCKHNPDGKLFEVPEYCPECGHELVFSEGGDIVSCVNPDCPCIIKGRILNYLDKMRIKGISFGIIDKLYDAGIVKSIQDLYKIKKHFSEISEIDGFGPKSIQAWIDELESHTVVDDYVLLGSLGIEGLSKKTFKKIMSTMTIDDMMEAAENKEMSKFVTIPGIQEKSARKLIDGLNSNKKLINFLCKELDIMDSKNRSTAFSICFTKIRDESLEKLIMSLGGEVSNSLTKNTTALCVPTMDTESSKVTKAKAYGIPIVQIDDLESFLDMIVKNR